MEVLHVEMNSIYVEWWGVVTQTGMTMKKK